MNKVTFEDMVKKLSEPQDSGIVYTCKCGNEIKLYWGEWGELRGECSNCQEKVVFDPYSEVWLMHEKDLPLGVLEKRKQDCLVAKKIPGRMVRLGNGLYVSPSVAEKWYSFCIGKK